MSQDEPTPLRIPLATLDVVRAIADLLEPLTNAQRGFVLRTLVQIALPQEELPR